MLQITIPEDELWDESRGIFIPVKEKTLQLEHSLIALSKWESKWCKAFFSTKEKTREETIDYVKCMTLTQNVKPEVYLGLTSKNFKEINDYIDAPMTAITFYNGQDKTTGREVITSELIYYWMISLNIPFECQKWHINRLLTLIRVCEIKNTPPKKMSRREIMSRNAALNEARRKKLNTKG